MKTLIYAVTLVSLSVISCGVQATLPTSIPLSVDVKSQATIQPTASPQVFTVCNSGGLRLRSAAGTANSELAILADGEIVSRTDTPSEYPAVYPWYEVVTEDGITGWVISKYLNFGTTCK
jgi:hypothetical protein